MLTVDVQYIYNLKWHYAIVSIATAALYTPPEKEMNTEGIHTLAVVSWICRDAGGCELVLLCLHKHSYNKIEASWKGKVRLPA